MRARVFHDFAKRGGHVWRALGKHVGVTPHERDALGRQPLEIANTTLPGITFGAPGNACTRPTVPTWRPGVLVTTRFAMST